MWINYLIIALRKLERDKPNALINLLSITLGLAGVLVVYAVVDFETGFDSFHSTAPNTFRVVHHNHTADGTQFWNTTAYPLADALRDEFPETVITQGSGPSNGSFTVKLVGEERRFEEDKVLFVDRYYFQVFDFEVLFPEGSFWLSGNSITAFDEPNAVVLTLSAARKYFKEQVANPDALLGKTLLYNDKDLMMVSGIVQDPPMNTNLNFDILLSYEFFKANFPDQATSWEGNHQGTTFMVIPEGAPLEYKAKIDSMQKKFLSNEDDQRIEYVLQPLSEVHTEKLYGSNPGSYVLSKGVITGLWTLAGFLLLIACMNFVNLATVQSLKRSREVGVRKVLGGTNYQIFSQYMCEAFLLTVVAFILAILLGKWVISEVNHIIDFVRFRFVFDQAFIFTALMLIALVTFLAGSYPGVVMSRFAPVTAIRQPSRSKGLWGFSLRQGLVVFQFIIAQALIAGTLIVAEQMRFIQQKDLGYQTENVLSIILPSGSSQDRETFKKRLEQNGDILKVSFSSGAPTTHEREYGTSFRLSYEPLEMRRNTEMKFIDEEYFDVFQLELVAGQMVSSKAVYNISDGLLVNETLVRMLGIDAEEAVGKELVTNEGKATIVGVLKDFHNNSLHEAIMPCVLVFWAPNFLDEANILLPPNPRGTKKALEILAGEWKEVYPNADFNYQFVDDSLQSFYKVEVYLYKAFSIASGLAIFIGCLGLFGLVSLVAQQRTKEIGIRKLVGGSLTSIVMLLSKDFLRLVLIAIALASPLIHYFMVRWLNNFAYHIELHWWYLLVAGLISLTITFLVVGLQSIKAGLTNPVQALRSE